MSVSDRSSAPSQRLRRGDGSARRARGDHGTAMIEFALVAPLVMLIVFGIIEFGFAFSAQLELRSASREGGRLAAVDNGCAASTTCGTALAQRDALIAATRLKASGLATASSIKASVSCSSGACLSAVPGDNVTVCLNYTLSSFTGLFSAMLDNKVIASKATFRLEQTPTFQEGSDAAGAPTCT
jgi:Flp pilus assembly protein TadG